MYGLNCLQICREDGDIGCLTLTNCGGRIAVTVMFTVHFLVQIQLSTETGENYGVTSNG